LRGVTSGALRPWQAVSVVRCSAAHECLASGLARCVLAQQAGAESRLIRTIWFSAG
jgi:hypothetical protein